jgi:probable HAF family extracellular repeat protein
MISYRRVLTIALTSTFAVPLLSDAAIPSQYRLTDIGSLGGGTTYGAALNNASPVQVTGTSWLGADTGPRAFLYNVGGSMMAINYGVDEATWGRGINDDGYVSADGGLSGFVYHNGVTTALPALSSTIDGMNVIGGISNSGFITGTAYSSTGPDSHAFRYSLVDNSMIDIGTGGGSSIGDVDVVQCGAVEEHRMPELARRILHASSNGPGVVHRCPAARGARYGDAYDVNDSGQLVGQASLLVGNQFVDRAFLHDGSTGATTLLTPLAGSDWDQAIHINNQGQIVGLGVTSAGVRAVLWSDNQVIDLNTRLEPGEFPPHVVLEQAVDINESGWILANGFDTRIGTTRAYLLEPIWP